jgi:hypothetical protein
MANPIAVPILPPPNLLSTLPCTIDLGTPHYPPFAAAIAIQQAHRSQFPAFGHVNLASRANNMKIARRKNQKNPIWPLMLTLWTCRSKIASAEAMGFAFKCRWPAGPGG